MQSKKNGNDDLKILYHFVKCKRINDLHQPIKLNAYSCFAREQQSRVYKFNIYLSQKFTAYEWNPRNSYRYLTMCRVEV